MGETEKTVKTKVHKTRYKKKTVFDGCNQEGKPYFKKIKVPIITQENSVDFQPTIDEFPPTDESLFETREEAQKCSNEKLVKKMDHDWEAAHSKDGRPPIGGAQDD
ncbi:hypothetical protein KJ570_00315 [Patescibacteria group bacterium]|nr:hypothetical protein [Patescibacteria group bacterium]MBU2036115.1 hypothetical protein [Patescibacteria group bacterium]